MPAEQNNCRRRAERGLRGAVVRRRFRSLTKARSGFTLVELLVTIVIIAILASIVLGAVAAAQRAANVAHTQALIAKLNSQLMLRVQSFQTRRLPISTAVVATNNPAGLPYPQNITLLQAAAMRLNVMRELQRMEMPDRYADITSPPFAPVAFQFDVQNSQWSAYATMQPTAVMRSYQNKLALNGNRTQPLYEDAECLYLILNGGLSDSDSLSGHIGATDVGDKDGDGMFEFIDAWGNPIHFLRWAPGFSSDFQPSPSDPVTHHDPFDPLKIQAKAFALTPLIWSDGPDGISDIQMPAKDPSTQYYLPSSKSYFTHSGFMPNAPVHIYDPYSLITATVGGPADIDGDGDVNGWADNITNHLQGQ